jgi:hypothetical protein
MAMSVHKFILIAAAVYGTAATAQETIQLLEPGIGYSRLKKWAIDSEFVFENYTKDTIVVRNTGKDKIPNIIVFAHFCAGDDYSGKANNIVIQENFPNEASQASADGSVAALTKQRRYMEILAGPPQEGKFKGTFTIRPERKDATGLGIQGESEKGKWEIGVFLYQHYTQLQVTRNKDSICN